MWDEITYSFPNSDRCTVEVFIVTMVNWHVISIAKQNRSPKRVDVAFRKCIEHVGTSLRLGGTQLAWATSVRQAIYLNNPESLLIGLL